MVSNNLLPLGSLGYLLFCIKKNGWGWDNFIKEANSGKGIKFPINIKWYMTYLLPVIVVVIYIKGYYDMFVSKGPAYLIPWMCVAVALLAGLGFMVLSKPDNKCDKLEKNAS